MYRRETNKPIVLVKGAGDIATGVIQALHRGGFRIVATEIARPSAIRRTVALSEAVYQGETQVEDIKAIHVDDHESSVVKACAKQSLPKSCMTKEELIKCDSNQQDTLQQQDLSQQQDLPPQQDLLQQDLTEQYLTKQTLTLITNEIQKIWQLGAIPIYTGEYFCLLKALNPQIIVDATLSKVNIAKTTVSEADLVIGLGPGFEADFSLTLSTTDNKYILSKSKDSSSSISEAVNCHIAIETMRGHNLGRIITQGSPQQNTGVPGDIKGFASERVLKAPVRGTFIAQAKIGDLVKQNQVVAFVENTGRKYPIKAKFTGLLRGILPMGYLVHEGMKCGDIDPRLEEFDNCFTISDKARALGGAVLQAIGIFYQRSI